MSEFGMTNEFSLNYHPAEESNMDDLHGFEEDEDQYASSLFLGDLSIYSTEKDIRQLFRPYGIIDRIRIKRGGSGKPHLSYGFIKFRERESAEKALSDLNGTVFLGRALRIGWAEPKNTVKMPKMKYEELSTAQIHVSYISKQIDTLITESTLRSLFENFGEVVDVAIKKSQFDKKLKLQNGYGFVHFPLTSEGIQAAVNATHNVHQVTVDRVTYDCSLSRLLDSYHLPEPQIFPNFPPKKTNIFGRQSLEVQGNIPEYQTSNITNFTASSSAVNGLSSFGAQYASNNPLGSGAHRIPAENRNQIEIPGRFQADPRNAFRGGNSHLISAAENTTSRGYFPPDGLRPSQQQSTYNNSNYITTNNIPSNLPTTGFTQSANPSFSTYTRTSNIRFESPVSSNPYHSQTSNRGFQAPIQQNLSFPTALYEGISRNQNIQGISQFPQQLSMSGFQVESLRDESSRLFSDRTPPFPSSHYRS